MLKFSGYPYLIRGQDINVAYWMPPAATRDAILLRSKPLKWLPIVLRRVRAEAGQTPNTKLCLRV